jgi:hypothetical protein
MEHTRFVGLDIHKERISIAVAASGRSGAVDYLGEIASRWRFLMRQTARLRRSSPTHKPRPSVRRGGAVADPDQARRAPLHRDDSDGLTEKPTETQGVA